MSLSCVYLQYAPARNAQELHKLQARWWRRGSLRLHYNREHRRFALNASNFTDEIFVDRCSSAANCFYGTRRLVTASLTRKF